MRHYDSNVWKDYVEGTIGNFDKSLMEQHMLLCDRCMEEYINAVETSGMVETAPSSLADNVMAAVKPKAEKAVKNTGRKPYTIPLLKYAAAASIALLLWKFGIFTNLSTGMLKADERPQRDSIFETALGSGFGDKMVDGINGMFDFITVKGENLFNEKKK